MFRSKLPSFSTRMKRNACPPTASTPIPTMMRWSGASQPQFQLTRRRITLPALASHVNLLPPRAFVFASLFMCGRYDGALKASSNNSAGSSGKA